MAQCTILNKEVNSAQCTVYTCTVYSLQRRVSIKYSEVLADAMGLWSCILANAVKQSFVVSLLNFARSVIAKGFAAHSCLF